MVQAPDGARDGDPLGAAVRPRARPRRAALRRRAPGRDPCLRLGGLPVHAIRVELEHERFDTARLPHLRLLARGVTREARCLLRALGLDEVRAPDRRAALDDLPGLAPDSAAGPLRRRLRRRDPGRLLDPAPGAASDPRGGYVLGPHVQAADPPRVAVLALGLAAVPRDGHP